MSTPAPPPSRPLGVAIIAFLIGLFGFVTLIEGILILAGVRVSALFPEISFFGGTVLGFVAIILGLVMLGVALGLWRLHTWALVLALLVLIVYLVIYGLAGKFLTFEFILSAILFVYLIAVSRHFT